jgi:hypothetical protein
MYKMKTVGRVAALALLLVGLMGPWFFDSHPATEETCLPPLVWRGDGLCACLDSVIEMLVRVVRGGNSVWLMCLIPALPFLSTPLLMLGRGRKAWWVIHIIAWGLTALFSLFFYLLGIGSGDIYLRIWGAGLSSLLAVAMLAGEIWSAKRWPVWESGRVTV